ncbi:MAG TPA: hypothetical protein VLE27_13510, partial [Thermoanaerobaculia bacterium]|nr:hypothetical protein [Thermoanaerobaculia bacterium]
MSLEVRRTATLEASTSSPSLPGGAAFFSAPSAAEASGLDKEVRALIDGALRWVMENLEEFDPFLGGRPFEMRHGQKVAELATMAHAYVKLTGDAENPDMERIFELLVSVRQSRELGDRLLRAPGELVLYFILYVVLRSRGHDDPAQRELLQRALDAGFLEHSERVDHRRMDVSLHLEWGGFDHSWPSLEEVYESSILRQDPSPLHLDENAVYAVTHIVMFLYGFGLREADVPHARSAAARRTLSELLVAACQEHHWDLLGELLLCLECAGFPPSPLFERGWRAFLAVQNENGAIPGPESALAAGSSGGRPLHADSAAPDPQPDFFAHHYHTTLVGILAGSLYLHRTRSGWNGFPTAPEEEAPRGRRRTNPPVREAVSRSRRWLGDLLEREETAPEDLCRLLLGCWICDSLLGTADAEFPVTAQRIGEKLIDLDRSGARFDGVPATLRLLAVALLEPWGFAVPALR